MKTPQEWWQSLSTRWRKWRVVGQVGQADEIPKKLPDKGVFLVGPSENSTWAAFDCPCKTGHRLMVNLGQNPLPLLECPTP